MKIFLKLLLAAMLILVFVGCAAQKLAKRTNAHASEVLYKQALQALSDNQFILEATEFYFPEMEKEVKYSADSFVTIEGTRVSIQFSQNVFPDNSSSYVNLTDDHAEISPIIAKKNGDVQLTIRITARTTMWLNRELNVTLFADSDRCFVQVNRGHGGNRKFNFRGHIRPLKK